MLVWRKKSVVFSSSCSRFSFYAVLSRVDCCLIFLLKSLLFNFLSRVGQRASQFHQWHCESQWNQSLISVNTLSGYWHSPCMSPSREGHHTGLGQASALSVSGDTLPGYWHSPCMSLSRSGALWGLDQALALSISGHSMPGHWHKPCMHVPVLVRGSTRA